MDFLLVTATHFLILTRPQNQHIRISHLLSVLDYIRYQSIYHFIYFVFFFNHNPILKPFPTDNIAEHLSFLSLYNPSCRLPLVLHHLPSRLCNSVSSVIILTTIIFSNIFLLILLIIYWLFKFNTRKCSIHLSLLLSVSFNETTLLKPFCLFT